MVENADTEQRRVENGANRTQTKIIGSKAPVVEGKCVFLPFLSEYMYTAPVERIG